MGFTNDDLARILGQPDYSVREDGVLLPHPSVQVKTDTEKELERQRRISERQRLENKFKLVAIGCAMQHGLREIEWVRNHEFDRPDSGLQFDFSLPAIRVAVEVNGGQGRGNESGHSSWTGLERDARKQNAAVYKGWTLFWLPTSMVNAEHVQPIIDYILGKMGQ